jgi:UDP-N-acetylmuramyl pentapeptide phosphotransferase/UDP-N-acetylglucosamine-1-phosphate transferase
VDRQSEQILRGHLSRVALRAVADQHTSCRTYNSSVLALISAFSIALAVTLAVLHIAKTRGHHLLDHDLSGPQKFHARAVPRVGGIGILVGLVVSLPVLAYDGPETGRLAMGLLACGIPAFAAGLVEDFTKRVSPRNRLIATAVSAALAIAFLDSAISRTDIPGLDWLLSFTAVSVLVTVLAVAGIANSVNIIDGFNGLASMCVVIMLGALAYVAYQVGDPVVGAVALAGIGAVLGFFFWNFPAGLIFLGDGGAYFLGFFVAELSILLMVRNAEVSPLFPLLVCIYPVFETLFSIYRRKFIRAVPPSMPDGIHLHSLIYRRVLRWAVGDQSAKAMTRRNSMTSPYLWALCMLSVVPASLFWNNSLLMGGFLVLFGLTYVGLYWRIVRFKSPRLMRRRTSGPMPLDAGDNRPT